MSSMGFNLQNYIFSEKRQTIHPFLTLHLLDCQKGKKLNPQIENPPKESHHAEKSLANNATNLTGKFSSQHITGQLFD